MATCFVIQPFDAGRYDKLFKDVYAPAITAAGYEPYRVDQDPSVSVPIESIESGIRSAVVCLADITTDNPNVWYELGYAFATGRPVVMICAEDRQGRKFPFDIQHRSIVTYKPDSRSDFEALEAAITERVKAYVSKDERLQQLSSSEPVSPVAGLSLPEFMLVGVLAGDFSAYGVTPIYSMRVDAERAGISGVGVNLGMRRLLAKNFVETVTLDDDHGNEYGGVKLTSVAWEWIDAHESMFVLHQPAGKPLEDDPPF